jgi:hypothetical protein
MISSPKIALTLFVFGLLPSVLSAQNTVQLPQIDVVKRKGILKQQSLYPDGYGTDEPEHVGNVYAVQVFDDFLTAEVWFTESSCLSVTQAVDVSPGDQKGLLLEWNKLQKGCPDWMGLGIGWDGWSGKDIYSILDSAALRMRVRAVKGKYNGLPLAICMEDYSDGQAWTGVTANTVDGGVVGEEWVDVILPLIEFDWNMTNANPSNVKQMIIQFEAEGAIWLDEIKIVPYKGGYRKEASLAYSEVLAPKLDGEKDAFWNNVKPFELGKDKVWMGANKTHLLVYAEIADDSPMLNPNNDENIWNGDALEIAFSSRPNLPIRRKNFLMSDQHIGLSFNSDPLAFNWRRKKPLERTQKIVKIVPGGVRIEWFIELAELGHYGFELGTDYNFEIAIDKGNGKNRTEQLRWNNPSNEGFHEDPSKWGLVRFNELDL